MELNFLGALNSPGAAMGSLSDEVAIGSPVPPEYTSANHPSVNVPRVGTYMAIAAAVYLLVFAFHVVTF